MEKGNGNGNGLDSQCIDLGIWICVFGSGSAFSCCSFAPSAALLLFIDALLCAIFVWPSNMPHAACSM